MLDIENDNVRQHLLEGNFGLERESLRVTGEGEFAHTAHPFEDDDHIVKDFCENQTEINTGVCKSAAAAVAELEGHLVRIYRALDARQPKEYLWQFSNPPHIKGEEDIPVAHFGGKRSFKSDYRKYLSDKYGRYKMTFCGIHVNFSFADELIKSGAQAARWQGSLREYADALYLHTARGLSSAGWVLTAATAASPVLDASFLQKDDAGDAFCGMASVRCSECGYWNDFAPVFDYTSIESYAQSIRGFVQSGLLKAPSELYYPIRLKPAGENNLDSLLRGGINRVELRMFDLNPLTTSGVDERDVRFAQLLILWVASSPPRSFTESEQVNAIHNFKNAAHFDLGTVRMMTPDGANHTLQEAAVMMIGEMKSFFREHGIEGVQDVLDFELAKFTNDESRYCVKVRQLYRERFAQKALELSKKRQEQYV